MSEMRRLGASGLEVSALGVGAWAWGDKMFWQYGTTHGREDVQAAYCASLDAGINFYDTAEIYGYGESERLLGDLSRESGRSVVIASKFAPLPYRLSAQALRPTLETTLARLKVKQLDLYQIHWPYTLIQVEDLMDALAEVVKAGLVRSVGVSNYNADEMKRAYKRLNRYGIPLASNQVQYSLLKRGPEANGVLKACQQLDVALIAYMPLEQGFLTGKYTRALPPGPRRFSPLFWRSRQARYKPLLDTIHCIAQGRGKTASQVVLNWLVCRDEHIIPIPGAKNGHQARENAGALGWSLSEEEFRRLDKASRRWLY
ncbi:MAG: aldo/keto reductase [Chloroflexota bacterium]